MPELMLKKDWPGNFHRTVTRKNGKSERLEFEPGVPVNLPTADVKLLEPDINVALLPVERDDKNRPRVITDDVEPMEENADVLSDSDS